MLRQVLTSLSLISWAPLPAAPPALAFRLDRAPGGPAPSGYCAAHAPRMPSDNTESPQDLFRRGGVSVTGGAAVRTPGRQSGAPVPRAAAPWTSRPCAPAPCAAAAPARWGRRQTCWRGSRCPRKESGCSESALRDIRAEAVTSGIAHGLMGASSTRHPLNCGTVYGCRGADLRAQCSPGSRHTCWGQP